MSYMAELNEKETIQIDCNADGANCVYVCEVYAYGNVIHFTAETK